MNAPSDDYRENNTLMRFPMIRPAVPAVERWTGFLCESYATRRFSNFGPLVTRLETILTATWGSDITACVLTSSGTAAIAAPLIAEGISGPVVLPAFTFPATLAAIRMANAEPVLMDVSPSTWTTDAETLDIALSRSGARAAVVLRPFGLHTDLESHARVAQRHGAVLVIDDAAGLGVERTMPERDRWVHESYSLHVTKPFGLGEGGAVFTHLDNADRIRRAINFGLPHSDATQKPTWGINGKMPEIQAAVGLAVAEAFAGQLARRRVHAASYIEALSAIPDIQCRLDAAEGAWQFFPLLLPSSVTADRFSDETRRRGMEIRRYYAPSLSRFHDVPRLSDCPVSEDLAERMCCVPVYADASDGELDYMVQTVTESLHTSLVRV